LRLFFLLCAALLPMVAIAAPPVKHRWSSLSGALTGRDVVVELAAGKSRRRGAVVRVEPSSLVLATDQTTLSLQRADIRRIRVVSNRKPALIGALLGAGAGAGLAAFGAGEPCLGKPLFPRTDETARPSCNYAAAAAIGGAAGGVAGYFLGSRFSRAAYVIEIIPE